MWLFRRLLANAFEIINTGFIIWIAVDVPLLIVEFEKILNEK